MNLFVFGSSIVSSYWNGAATYYRGCYKHLARRGHRITFAEPDAHGRQHHRDDEDFSYVHSIVYQPGIDLDRVLTLASKADVVIKHSGIGADDSELDRKVPEYANGISIFWDVDAPATLRQMRADSGHTLHASISRYDAILTYGGGPHARERYLAFGARAYYSIYNALDPATHFPVAPDPSLECDVAFLGNRLPDRESRVEELFLHAAALAPELQFLLGGEGWADKPMPSNVRYIGHVPTSMHNRLNCSAGMVMNINRTSMADFGYSPPTRMFEAAGAASCLLCDEWPGIADCFHPGAEILVVRTANEVVAAVRQHNVTERRSIGLSLRKRALRDHTYERRARQVEFALSECIARKTGSRGRQHTSLATMADWIDEERALPNGLCEEACV